MKCQSTSELNIIRQEADFCSISSSGGLASGPDIHSAF